MTGHGAARRRPIALALLLAGLVVGALSFAFARDAPSYAFAGGSLVRAALELAAGYSLIAVGIASWWRRPESRFGALLAMGGVAWFLVEWNNPGIGSSLAFTIGLTLYAAAPPLLAHAALGYPGGRLRSGLEQLGVTIAYVGSLLVLGLFPTLVFDPTAAGCGQCPTNLLLVRDSPGLFDDLNRIGVGLGLAWSLALISLLMFRFFQSTPALRRLIWPALAAVVVYLGLVAVDFAHSLDRGFVGNDAIDIDLRFAQTGALFAFALGVAWDWVRARRTRGEVARLVVELAGSPAPGGLRDRLADALGDPSLVLAYPLGEGRLVDVDGRSVDLGGDVTALMRDGREVARLSHRRGLLDDPGLVEGVATAARLALENERLRAYAGAQLETLRA